MLAAAEGPEIEDAAVVVGAETSAAAAAAASVAVAGTLAERVVLLHSLELGKVVAGWRSCWAVAALAGTVLGPLGQDFG